MSELMEEITQPEIKKFREAGLLNEYAVRNMKIRQEYMCMRRGDNTVHDILATLSMKYFLGIKRIEQIVARKSHATKPFAIGDHE